MNKFNIILEITTGKKNLSLKTIGIKDIKDKEKTIYFVYYFDKQTNSYYFN